MTVPGTFTGGSLRTPSTIGSAESSVETPKRRVNLATAAVCDRAVRVLNTAGRQYADTLLQMYGLKTATIMRVLYDPSLRRKLSVTDSLKPDK